MAFVGLQQACQGENMSVGKIADMDIIAHAGTVGRVVIGAEDRHVISLAQRSLDRNFDQMRCTCGRLARSALRIGTRDIEIAQHAIVEIMRERRVRQQKVS